MRVQFKTTLKGDDVVVDYPLKENQNILSKECTIIWHIAPQVEQWGIRYWRAMMEKFECVITIQNIGDEKPEKVVIDSIKFYNMEIDDTNYKMAQDFCIKTIQIDRKNNTAIGVLNG